VKNKIRGGGRSGDKEKRDESEAMEEYKAEEAKRRRRIK
jgi:hypothetical protein